MKKAEKVKVYKFGGASIRNAGAVRNMAEIIGRESSPLVIVVSAMGKTTNALEEILEKARNGQSCAEFWERVKNFHVSLVEELFEKEERTVLNMLQELFCAFEKQLESLAPEYDEAYDQLVSFGELFSSAIVAAYLNSRGFLTEWVDARKYVKTDGTFRDGYVNWDMTGQLMRLNLPSVLEEKHVLTQGFIAGDVENHTVTLGREGSDFTAAVFASCLQASEVTIWKDVAGIMNADPKRVAATVKYDELSYREAAEMTFYGASVIHPKTIKPLANKKIPLWVRSFESPEERGTVIKELPEHQELPEAIIFKDRQTLVSFKAKDLSFLHEQALGKLFKLFTRHHIRINLLQNTAISLAVCFDSDQDKVLRMLDGLREEFEIQVIDGLQLVTVKNYRGKNLLRGLKKEDVLLEQKTLTDYQFIIREEMKS